MFSKKAEIGLGRLRGPSWEMGTPLHCSSSGNIVAPVGLEVCDGAHSLGVMKKGWVDGTDAGAPSGRKPSRSIITSNKIWTRQPGARKSPSAHVKLAAAGRDRLG